MILFLSRTLNAVSSELSVIYTTIKYERRLGGEVKLFTETFIVILMVETLLTRTTTC